MANGKKFSIDFQQAQEIENTTQILIQSEGWPVQKATLEQIGRALIKGNIVPSFTGNYPKMSVGFAENIVGDGSATEEEFSFRPTAGVNRNTLNDGAARIHTLKGNSVVYNQFANITNFTALTQYGVTVSYDNGKLLCRGTYTGGEDKNFYIGNYTAPNAINIPRHKYLCQILGNKNMGGTIYGYGGSATFDDATIITSLQEGQLQLVPRIKQETEIGTIIDETIFFIISDLTRMFGAGNEPVTVAEFYQRLPIGVDINAYNAGEIVDGNYGAIKTIGFNAFNGTYAKVLGGVQYYLGGNYTSIGFATEEGGTTEAITVPTSSEVVGGSAPADRLYTPSQNGYIYATGENICISLYWPTEYGNLYGTYKPYKPFERDLGDIIAKYFTDGIMRSAGSVRDEIRFNSSTQKWEAVQRVSVRAYTEGDENDTTVTTDSINTNYPLTNPIITEIEEMPNFDFDVSDYGTEELIVAEGEQSAPVVADIEYSPNVLAVLKNAPGIANDVDALKSQVAALTAQLAAITTANTNE